MEGGCLCGAIRYTLTGAPLYQCLCYCGDCQKSTGSAFIQAMEYPSARFKLHLSSTTVMKQYANLTCKGTERLFHFCGTCGSLIFGGRYAEGSEHSVYAGTLDAQFRDRFKPTFAIFTEQRPGWLEVQSELVNYPRTRDVQKDGDSEIKDG